LRDVIVRLPDIAAMGFDIVYLPPIHPVGRAHRKGRNNAVTAAEGDVGSPWAIGAAEGGHKSILPELGTFADFEELVTAARSHQLEIALDIAFQCAPDHPYVTEHPDWFRQRPDGTIQYAENPPKKYQDIYPFDFECADWMGLWRELKSVFEFWIERGVRTFRVDNPHTKPFPFWEWALGELKRQSPELIFLSEAFTRPKVMYRLAKLGFTQSYTYFAWRHSAHDLTSYCTELTQTDVAEFFQPNFWPNTPDILTAELQTGGRPAFVRRLILAATLSSSYGIYGPPFEHQWSAAREPGSEEYLHSEKYQLHHHDWERPDSLRDLITQMNRIRRQHPALQTNAGLQFHPVDNDQLLCYSKTAGEDRILVIVNLHSGHTHSGFVTVPLQDWGLDGTRPFAVHDLLSDTRYEWCGPRNYVELAPQQTPAHVFAIGPNYC
jgi:starch synthase (maltosyl-transferring)